MKKVPIFAGAFSQPYYILAHLCGINKLQSKNDCCRLFMRIHMLEEVAGVPFTLDDARMPTNVTLETITEWSEAALELESINPMTDDEFYEFILSKLRNNAAESYRQQSREMGDTTVG